MGLTDMMSPSESKLSVPLKADGKEEGVPQPESKSKDSYSSQGISQPPTPGNLPVPSPMSPSSASISSFHGDESDSISSPGWPKTPSSPVSGPGCLSLFVIFGFRADTELCFIVWWFAL